MAIYPHPCTPRYAREEVGGGFVLKYIVWGWRGLGGVRRLPPRGVKRPWLEHGAVEGEGVREQPLRPMALELREEDEGRGDGPEGTTPTFFFKDPGGP